MEIYKILLRDYKIIGITENFSTIMRNPHVLDFIHNKYETLTNNNLVPKEYIDTILRNNELPTINNISKFEFL